MSHKESIKIFYKSIAFYSYFEGTGLPSWIIFKMISESELGTGELGPLNYHFSNVYVLVLSLSLLLILKIN